MKERKEVPREGEQVIEVCVHKTSCFSCFQKTKAHIRFDDPRVEVVESEFAQRVHTSAQEHVDEMLQRLRVQPSLPSVCCLPYLCGTQALALLSGFLVPEE